MQQHLDAAPEGYQRPITHKKALPKITAQTTRQKVYMRKLAKGHHDILIASGPAGTGKTYLAVLEAIKEYRAGNIDKIIVTRPNVGAGDDLGHLPGSLIEKMAPWMQPILDVFKECYEVHEVERMLRDEIIEISPLVFMRGRTFKNAFVIADEMQNTTVEQFKMFLTRIGENSRMVITGDMEQHDRGHERSGLEDFLTRWYAKQEAAVERDVPLAALHVSAVASDEDDVLELTDVFDRPAEPRIHDRIGHINFTREDVVRHAVISEVLAIYG
jgi:phosphate starvation-inducible PhoH-like protein